MSAAVSDVDHGYAALVARVFSVRMARPVIEVGILDVAGDRPHAQGDALTVFDVGMINEFGATFTASDGTKHEIPARSFIRAWFDEQEPELRDDLVKLLQAVVRGERTGPQILELLGQRMVGQIQERISDGIDPENAASTVARKGSSTPVIDTGVLRSSVSYRVNG